MTRLIVGVTAFIAAAAIVVFLLAGLENGDRLASMAGAIFAVLGLGFTARGAAASRNRPEEPVQHADSIMNVEVKRSWFVTIVRNDKA